MISIGDVTLTISHITHTRVRKKEVVKQTRMQYRSTVAMFLLAMLTTTNIPKFHTRDIQYCGWNYVIIKKNGFRSFVVDIGTKSVFYTCIVSNQTIVMCTRYCCAFRSTFPCDVIMRTWQHIHPSIHLFIHLFNASVIPLSTYHLSLF